MSPERRKKSGQLSHVSRALVLLSEQEEDWNLCADVRMSSAETTVRFLPGWLNRGNTLGAAFEKKISIWLRMWMNKRLCGVARFPPGQCKKQRVIQREALPGLSIPQTWERPEHSCLAASAPGHLFSAWWHLQDTSGWHSQYDQPLVKGSIYRQGDWVPSAAGVSLR